MAYYNNYYNLSRGDIGRVPTLIERAKNIFSPLRRIWLEATHWAAPDRGLWLQGRTRHAVPSYSHIVDSTHLSHLRSYQSGMLEGNTSTHRPWFRCQTGNKQIDFRRDNHKWLEIFTNRCLRALSSSNFYDMIATAYRDVGVVGNAGIYIEEVNGGLNFILMDPGSYYIINDHQGVPVVLVREFSLTVRALVERYAMDSNGRIDWSNISNYTRQSYETGNQEVEIIIAHVVEKNTNYNAKESKMYDNMPWLSTLYEYGITEKNTGTNYTSGFGYPGPAGEFGKHLSRVGLKRKPFLVAKTSSASNFEYGQSSPTIEALGHIRSLNKMAKDRLNAVEMSLKPPVQGPANMVDAKVATTPNQFIGLKGIDPRGNNELKPVVQINPRISALLNEVNDWRSQIARLYYSDYLVYLINNPKTRTATETEAIEAEKSLIIGPVLQSLNFSLNNPTVEYVMEYVLDEDPYLPPTPEDIIGQRMEIEYISIFAQSQRSADLPNIERFASMVAAMGEVKPTTLDVFDEDGYVRTLQDRLFAPAELLASKSQVNAIREQRLRQQQQALQMQQATDILKSTKQQRNI